MTIHIHPDRIQFSKFSLKITDDGLELLNSFPDYFDPKTYANFILTKDASIEQFSPLYGTVAGYTSGGRAYPTGAPPSQLANIIDKFPFATDSNATDVGDLTVARSNVAGQSSDVSGYSSGGNTDNPQPSVNTIDRFSFATNSNATDVGDLSQARRATAGQSSTVSGYTSGGYYYSAPAPPQPVNARWRNTIDKFPFATNSNASDVGDLTINLNNLVGQSSSVSGYASGGGLSPDFPGPQVVNIIQKFPFAIDTNASDVGDMIVARRFLSGQSSTVSGYASGGYFSPTNRALNVIEKFPFATDSNASDVGDLDVRKSRNTGQSSNASGYSTGGEFLSPPAPAIFYNTINKFPFATDSNASDVGDLTVIRSDVAAGQQD